MDVQSGEISLLRGCVTESKSISTKVHPTKKIATANFLDNTRTEYNNYTIISQIHNNLKKAEENFPVLKKSRTSTFARISNTHARLGVDPGIIWHSPTPNLIHFYLQTQS